MASDDVFEPRLGKIRAQRPKMPKAYSAKVMKAVHRGGGLRLKANGSPKSVSKYGRGAGVARVLTGTPKRPASLRRVVVKARVVKLAGKGLKAATAHLAYIQRDGVTREGQAGALYGPTNDREDARAFMERSQDDRHQFRFIVAPEEGAQYDDLKPLTRKVMTQMEADLGTRLDWVAVDHHNTGHPHTHIVIRGKDDQGKDLVMAREYISAGFRERVEAQVSLDLGPRSDLEINAAKRAEIIQERFTSIDRHLLHDADDKGQVRATHGHPETQALRAGRLAKLAVLGLAENVEPGQWQLRTDMEVTLRRLGERGDIIKTLHADLKQRGLEHSLADAVIHDGDPATRDGGGPITGRLLKRGLADEERDRHFVLVEATDGRVHYVDIGQGDRTGPVGANAIIRLTPKVPEVRAVDHMIVEVAASNNHRYSIDAHLKFDPTARQAFAETHMRRLEAIRRTTGGVERDPDGQIRIGADYLTKALTFEQNEARATPVRVEVVADLSLAAQVKRNGVTWLDRELIAGGGSGYATSGFGQEAKSALQLRQQWLLQEGLASEMSGDMRLHDKLIETLHRRELATIAADISKTNGLAYTVARNGERVEGTLRQSVSSGSGKFAVVERARDFTLVPWRPVLDNHIGKPVSGIVREAGINWTIGRGLDRE